MSGLHPNAGVGQALGTPYSCPGLLPMLLPVKRVVQGKDMLPSFTSVSPLSNGRKNVQPPSLELLGMRVI